MSGHQDAGRTQKRRVRMGEMPAAGLLAWGLFSGFLRVLRSIFKAPDLLSFGQKDGN